MANRNDIISLPDKRLREKSKKISDITPTVKKLVANMEEATLDWEDHREHEFGVALAAVQIGELYRVVVVRANMEDKSDRSFVTMINPKIVSKAGRPVVDFEGCLSVPDLYGKVPRYPKVKVKAMDLEGREFSVKAEGFLARVMQHEIDHTNGIVFIDHIKNKPDAFYVLSKDGKIEDIDYESKIKQSDILW